MAPKTGFEVMTRLTLSHARPKMRHAVAAQQHDGAFVIAVPLQLAAHAFEPSMIAFAWSAGAGDELRIALSVWGDAIGNHEGLGVDGWC